jgi:hypothetical protein
VNWHDLWVGGVAGVVATVVWTFGAWLYGWWRLRQAFNWLNGTYDVRRKESPQLEPESVQISVRGNLLHISMQNVPDAKLIKGWIAMNEQLPRSGRGHYTHLKSNGDELWGFWDVQLAKERKSLFVHANFVDATRGVEVVSGYIWRQAG